MNKEMKVIDLLNKIANGEEVPKHIRFGDINYYYNEEYKTYEYDKNVELYKWTILGLCLNDEVEILEEEKEIPEKLDHLIGYDIQQFDDLKEYVEITTNDLFGKVNKVIDTLNQLIDYLKSKGK